MKRIVTKFKMKICKLKNFNNEEVFPDLVEQTVSISKTKVPSSSAVKTAIENVSKKLIQTQVLWINPNPDANFENQEVVVSDLSSYKYIEIIFIGISTVEAWKNIYSTGLIPNDTTYPFMLNAVAFDEVDGAIFSSRKAKIISDSKINFAKGLLATSLTSCSVRKDACVPYLILGYN